MRYCPNCGHPVPDMNKFCGECGYMLSSGQNVMVKKTVKKVKKKHPVKQVKQVRSVAPQMQQQPQTQQYVPQQIDYQTKAEEEYIKGDFYAALDNYKLASMYDPTNFDLVMAKEKILEMLNHKDQAVDCLDEALRLHPTDRELWKNKSRLLLLLYHEKGDGKYKKASEEASQKADSLRKDLINQGFCPTCNASGSCLKCHGSGYCHECGGTGVYKGAVKCPFCEGTGSCDRCQGTSKCSDCHGTGQLQMRECENCNGSGICSKCHGTGKHLIGHCKECDGSGYCPVCKGKGKVTNIPVDPAGEQK